jgi:hypothetical protein
LCRDESSGAFMLNPEVTLTMFSSVDTARSTDKWEAWKTGVTCIVEAEDHGQLYELLLDSRCGVSSATNIMIHAGVLWHLAVAGGVKMLTLPDAPIDWSKQHCYKIMVLLNSRLAQLSALATKAGMPTNADTSSPRRASNRLKRLAVLATPPSNGAPSCSAVTPWSAPTQLGKEPVESEPLPRRLQFTSNVAIDCTDSDHEVGGPFSRCTARLDQLEWPAFCSIASELCGFGFSPALASDPTIVQVQLDHYFRDSSELDLEACQPSREGLEGAKRALMLLLTRLQFKRTRTSTNDGGSSSSHSGGSTVQPVFIGSTAAKPKSDGDPDAEGDRMAELALLERVNRNTQAQRALNELAVAVEAQNFDQLRTAQKDPASADLQRLFAMTSSVTGDSTEGYPLRHILTPLMKVRAGLDKLAAPVVLDGEGRVQRQRSAGFRAQVTYIRRGQLSKLRLAKLVGKVDTSGNAWGFLDSVKHASGVEGLEGSRHDMDAASVLVMALDIFAELWNSLHSWDSDATKFTQRLRRVANEHRNEGALSYERMGQLLWTPLVAQLDAQFEAHVYQGIGDRGLDLSLLKDHSDIVRGLAKSAFLAVLRKGGKSKGVDQARIVDSPPSKTKQPKDKSSEGKGKGKQNGKHEGKVKETGAPKTVPRWRSEDPELRIVKGERSLGDIAKKLKESSRMCVFFHADKGCLKSANCEFVHSGKAAKVE